jgi:hypothetical protein
LSFLFCLVWACLVVACLVLFCLSSSFFAEAYSFFWLKSKSWNISRENDRVSVKYGPSWLSKFHYFETT